MSQGELVSLWIHYLVRRAAGVIENSWGPKIATLAREMLFGSCCKENKYPEIV